MHKINKRGQSTVEYILLVAAVIAVMVAFTTNPNAGVQNQLNSTLGAAYQQVSDMSDRYTNAEPVTNGNSPANPMPLTVVPGSSTGS